MSENIDLRPAGQIERRPCRQELEASPGESLPPLAGEHVVKPQLKVVKIKHIRGGVLDLRLAERRRPQSEDCCCFDRSTPRSSFARSFKPCLSVKVRTSREAIFVQ